MSGRLEEIANKASDRVDFRGVELIDAMTLKPEPIRWLWPEWLARGKLHVLAGAPGTGKTTLAMDIAACVSASRALPGGFSPPSGTVLIWSGEDDPADTLIPRLIAAGANLSLIRFVGDMREGRQRYPFDPSRDIGELADAAAALGDVSMLIVDPLVSAVSGDSHKNAEVRRGLAPLVDLAARLDATLLGITHYSKGTQGQDPIERVTGSLAFGALARVVLCTGRRDSDSHSDVMVLARAKSNIGPDGGGFTFAFEQRELSDHHGVIASRIVWGARIEGTPRELLAEPKPEAAEDDATSAVAWLREFLRAEDRSAKEVFRAAADAGFSRDQIKRAKRKAGVETKKLSMSEGWVWGLRSDEGGPEEVEESTPTRPHPSLASISHALPSGPCLSCAGEGCRYCAERQDVGLPTEVRE